MDLISELENEFNALSESKPPAVITLRSETREYEIRLPQLGKDFILGLWAEGVIVFPLGNILEIRSASLPLRLDLTLEAFLEKQRMPVRIRLRSIQPIGECWLLNAREGWLRVAISQGVSWIPISAIQNFEILAVDNLNR